MNWARCWRLWFRPWWLHRLSENKQCCFGLLLPAVLGDEVRRGLRGLLRWIAHRLTYGGSTVVVCGTEDKVDLIRVGIVGGRPIQSCMACGLLRVGRRRDQGLGN